MPDTQTEPEVIVADTTTGPYPRLTPAAVERAKNRLGITDIDALAQTLGFSRQSFWRVRHGRLDIRLSHALRVAHRLGLTLNRAFDNWGPHA